MKEGGSEAARRNLARAIGEYDAAVQRAAIDGKRENERAIRYAADAVVTAARRALRSMKDNSDE